MKKWLLLILCLIPLFAFANEYVVGDHELLLMSTAYTMPSSNSYFTVYEVVFLNYVYALSNTTHIGAFTLFPIVSEALETLTLGVKQNFLRSDVVEGALTTTYTFKSSSFSLGSVFSIGRNRGNSFHAGAMFFVPDSDIEGQLVIMGGYRYDPSEKVSLIAEYTNLATLMEEDFNGLISIGVRMRSSHMSWELAGIRPLAAAGDLIMIPLLKATYYFH